MSESDDKGRVQLIIKGKLSLVLFYFPTFKKLIVNKEEPLSKLENSYFY